ncbi:hypothetical protein BDDG_13351, partial [Blastomyces dermatitidis ATCC 18188]
FSYIDRSTSANDSELNVESLIENLKNRIITLLNSVKIVKDICIFRNENMNIILFYTCRCKT